jgi:hypothetical protein
MGPATSTMQFQVAFTHHLLKQIGGLALANLTEACGFNSVPGMVGIMGRGIMGPWASVTVGAALLR